MMLFQMPKQLLSQWGGFVYHISFEKSPIGSVIAFCASVFNPTYITKGKQKSCRAK